MASFYPSEGDMLPPTYLLNQKHPSYSSSEVDNDTAYVCQPSVSLSYSNFLYTRQLVESETVATRDEVYVPPTNGNGTQQIDRQMNIIAPRYTDGNTVVADTGLVSNESRQCHGLSLTLGSQESSLVQLHSDMNQFASSNYHPLLSSNVQPEAQMQQYLSFGFPGKSRDTVRFGAGNDVHNLINSKGSNFASSLHQASDFTGGVGASKYVKAAQDLLDELVSAHRAAPKEKAQKFNALGQDGSTERDAVSNELQEPANNAPRDLSPSERHDLPNKVTKLLSMLDEVDRRYKQYCHQMQVVVSSFEMLAGHGAAHPYTALTLRTISRQFRCLRDAIKKQIQAAQNILGEQDIGPNGVGVLSRLRYVDQQLRQQKAIQQYGVMRQPWRPQRGLPETAVSVLRAWLFEHFLHPYPKDSEKLVLARQTGLTRSQVANWFINARVRLWKPMIEEMYKEEFGEAKSSPEHATTNQEISAFDDREEEFQGRLMSPALDGNSCMHSNPLAPDMISSSQGNTSRATLTYDNDEAFPGNEVNFGLMHLQQQGKQVSQTIFPYHNASINTTTDDKHLDLITNVTSMDQVSLALGLQNSDVDSKLLPDETQQKGIDSSSSSMPLDKLDYYYVDPVSNQHRFANANLLSDFVS